MSKEKSQALLAMEEAKKAHKQVKNEYEQAVALADRAVSKAQRAHDKAVSSAESLLNTEKTRLDKPIETIGSAKLYWDHVQEGKSSLALEDGMTVEVNSSGNVYSTAATKGKVGVSVTGAVVGGLIAGPIGAVAAGKKNKVDTKNSVHDSRNLFITLRTSSNALTIQCNPDKEKQARDFADAIVRAAANMSGVFEDHTRKLETLQQQIAAVRNDTADIDEAAAESEAVKNDTAAMDMALQTFEQAKALVPADELTNYEHGKKVRRNVIIAVAVLIIVVIVVCCIIFLR
ncbi:hypothetical protein [Bifidobacterium sp. ESL0790]|uniref:hypothetical protein n=1 Tax=Bifidobacterium sp. ESL0790 TaxID=2983233 RepID=UPI0023FA23AD|nr:hypothetical protein [Bifidobacterium sp. ESL0790]WEV73011.1 hypothetical protein OZY47_03425 [Bifidobacterium sp. ESL0790]